MAVTPERLHFDATGAPWSARYDDVYASSDGALGQARHVFLGGNGLPQRWRGREQFVVLETGFGLGVNFMATWQAWRDDAARPRRLHYVAFELHPLAADDLRGAACAELQPLAAALAAGWPLPLPGLHALDFEDGAVRLTLALGDARALLPSVAAGADAIYLDGFAPAKNPELWEPALLRAVGRTARPGATLATYSTAAGIQQALTAAGFALERRPGYGRKREMLAGRYAPCWRVRRHEPPAAYVGARSAAVIGAGLAGSACAAALAQRGWQVCLVDSAATPRGATALPWGLMHGHYAADDNTLARLARAGAAHALRALARQPAGHGSWWQRCGYFELHADPAEAARREAAVRRQGWPDAWLSSCSAQEAAVRLGVTPRAGGLWWPASAIIAPAAWAAALRATPGVSMRVATVGQVVRAAEGWQVNGVDGAPLAQAAIVIGAAALDTPRLLGAHQLPMRPVPGQVTLLDAPVLATLDGALGGDGTLLRSPDGTIAVGATYETVDDGAGGLAARDADRSNLERLSRLLAAAPDVGVAGRFAGTRCVARDRLPYVGALADEAAAAAAADALRGAHAEDLPRRAGLYAACAYGSRGLTFAALAAELIAAHIEGEPLPLERDLVHALDPARVLLRRLRGGKPPVR
jgi:tRNA 5-methylaminomethyl-2-thiouridine biosynthesis bifunctional protein